MCYELRCIHDAYGFRLTKRENYIINTMHTNYTPDTSVRYLCTGCTTKGLPVAIRPGIMNIFKFCLFLQDSQGQGLQIFHVIMAFNIFTKELKHIHFYFII